METDISGIFDELDVCVIHGWICLDLDIDYNSAMELILSSPVDEDKRLLKHRIQEFIHTTPSQLTFEGLELIISNAPPLSILFRNNHFSVLLVRDKKVYSLITASSFLDQRVFKFIICWKHGNV